MKARLRRFWEDHPVEVVMSSVVAAVLLGTAVQFWEFVDEHSQACFAALLFAALLCLVVFYPGGRG